MYSSYSSYQPKRSPVKPQRKKHDTVIVAVLLVGVIFFFWWLMARTNSSSEATAKAKHTTTPAPTPLPAVNMAALEQKITSIITNNRPLETSVSIVDIKAGVQKHYGVTAAYKAASTAKLLTATQFLHQVETGKATMTDRIGSATADAQLRQLIVYSDNAAWDAFLSKFSLAVQQDYATQIGLPTYKAVGNLATSEDVAIILNKLYKRELLNEAHTTLLLSYMKQANYDTYIPASVSDGITVYHKAGWLDDRVHDAAIIDDGKRPYILVIFTKSAGNYDVDLGHEIYDDITKATLSAFVQ